MGLNRVAPIVTGQSTAQTIKGSLRFNSSSSQYLSRTPGSSGNRKTWTWSGWVKRSKLGVLQMLFGSGQQVTNDSVYSYFRIDGNDKLNFRQWPDGAGSLDSQITSTLVLRDTSAWYHIIFAYDSTQSIDADKVKLYINGVRVTAFDSADYPGSNVDSQLNNTKLHTIGSSNDGGSQSSFWDGYLSNVTFIDGQSLGPGFFGFTDPLTGTWRPKRLKDGAPTVNNGTDWAANYTGGVNPGLNVNNLWDGSTSTYVNNVWGSTPLEYTLPPVHFETLEIYGSSNGGSTNYIKVNGVNVTKQFNQSASNGWTTITGVKGPLTTITTYTASAGDYNSIYAVRVDGVVMVRNTTTNVNFGTNGFYLPLDDQNDYTTDKSGKGNNWTANGFTGTSSNPDVVPDSPSGIVGSTKPTSGITTTSSITKPTNYATLNPLFPNPNGGTYSNGNLRIVTAAGNGHYRANVGMTTGKWYWETIPVSGATPGIHGIGNDSVLPSQNPGQSTGSFGYYSETGYKQTSGTDAAYGSTYTYGDVIGCAYDATNGKIYWSKNGVWQGGGDPVAGTNAAFTNATSTPYYPLFCAGSGSNTVTVDANFGQRPFKYQPPDGYLTLCSSNARPSTVIARPDQYVGVTTYTGNGSTQSINVGFKPDLVWVKNRNGANNNVLQDSVRGFGSSKNLSSNQTQIEGADTDGVITGVTNTGFNVSVNGVSGNGTNRTNYTYVGWCWKAGGGSGTGGEFWKDDVKYATASAAGLTAGTITPTGASVGTKQGFSIIKYNGNATPGATVPHGLSQTPDLVIVKQTSGTDESWRVRHSSVDPTKTLYLNQTVGETSNTEYISGATSSTFTLSTGLAGVNASQGYIAYCWHSVPGLQKFGSYTGNGVSGDGPYIHLGFRPRFFMHKRTDAGDSNQDWRIWDSERVKYNTIDTMLQPNDSAGDYTNSAVAVDFLSNGVKIRATDTTNNNASGGTYIYAAFAEAPAFNLYSGQSLAR